MSEVGLYPSSYGGLGHNLNPSQRSHEQLYIIWYDFLYVGAKQMIPIELCEAFQWWRQTSCLHFRKTVKGGLCSCVVAPGSRSAAEGPLSRDRVQASGPSIFPFGLEGANRNVCCLLGDLKRQVVHQPRPWAPTRNSCCSIGGDILKRLLSLWGTFLCRLCTWSVETWARLQLTPSVVFISIQLASGDSDVAR
jgi:hypothetical protein